MHESLIQEWLRLYSTQRGIFFFFKLISKSAGRLILLGMTQSYEQAFVCVLILNNQSKFIKMLRQVLFPGILMHKLYCDKR